MSFMRRYCIMSKLDVPLLPADSESESDTDDDEPDVLVRACSWVLKPIMLSIIEMILALRVVAK